MAYLSGHSSACKEIAEALGIKHCKKLDIRMRLDEIVTVEAKFYPEIDGVKQLEPIFKKYELVERTEEYGLDGDKTPVPKNFVNERDLKCAS